MKNVELNKISAAILLAGLIAMIAGFVTDILYQPHTELAERGYKVEIADVSSNKNRDRREERLDIASLMSEASVERGAVVAKKCAACHSFDKGQPHKVGPNLWNLVGKAGASKGSYVYSAALQEKGITWSYEELFAFLKNPKKYVPGTKMSFAGIRKPKDIASLVEFLRSKGDSNYPLPQ